VCALGFNRRDSEVGLGERRRAQWCGSGAARRCVFLLPAALVEDVAAARRYGGCRVVEVEKG
jgi:hypothetical protein